MTNIILPKTSKLEEAIDKSAEVRAKLVDEYIETVIREADDVLSGKTEWKGEGGITIWDKRIRDLKALKEGGE